jgi:hypothetical protein
VYFDLGILKMQAARGAPAVEKRTAKGAYAGAGVEQTAGLK